MSQTSPPKKTAEDFTDKFRIIGCDGEGYFNTLDKTHMYDVFTVGDRTLNGHGSHIDIYDIVDAFRMETLDALSAGVTPIFIGYFYTYDITQMIRTLDNYQLGRLYERGKRTHERPKPKDDPKYKRPPITTNMVSIDEGDKFSPRRFQMDFLEGKSLTLRFPIPESLNKARLAKDESKIKWARAKVQDVGTIFGSSFINAMKSFQIPLSEAETKALYDGKQNRAINCGYEERAAMLSEIVEYNRLEIRLMYRLITTLIGSLKEIGAAVDVKNDLAGIGALASKFLSQQAETHDILPSYEVAETLTAEVYQFANDGFFGGWAETFRPGLHDRMYQADITSAYPDTMRNLPSLKDAYVSTVNGLGHAFNAHNAGSIVFVDVTFEGTQDYIGCLPFRTAENNVIRPRHGRGKHLYSEVIAADNAGLIKSLTFHSGFAITPSSDEKPFEYMEKMFQERLKVGKKTVKGAIIKVLMNSQYGKIAQSIGNPKWANSVYASMITAGARIKLLEAIGSHPDGLTATMATATDAVFFSSPHTGLDETPNTLGAWETESYTKAFLMKPGIWGGINADNKWDGIIGDDPHEAWSVKTRGIGHDSFVMKLYETVIPQLEKYQSEKVWDEEFGFNTENTFSMMTLGEAFNRNRLDEVGEFLQGDHGLPELVREVRFNLSPKRGSVYWDDEINGFMTTVPSAYDEDKPFTIPQSMDCQSLIGNVMLDIDG